MRDLFRRLKVGGINIDISTFSKASKKREIESFKKIYQKLSKKIQRKGDRHNHWPMANGQWPMIVLSPR